MFRVAVVSVGGAWKVPSAPLPLLPPLLLLQPATRSARLPITAPTTRCLFALTLMLLCSTGERHPDGPRTGPSVCQILLVPEVDQRANPTVKGAVGHDLITDERRNAGDRSAGEGLDPCKLHRKQFADSAARPGSPTSDDRVVDRTRQN